MKVRHGALGASLVSSLVVLHAFTAAATMEWGSGRRYEEAGGFTVYERQNDESGLSRFRLEAERPEATSRVVAALMRMQTDDRFLAENQERIVLSDDPDGRLVLMRVDLPLVKDREVALRTRENFGADGSYRFSWRVAEDAPPPTSEYARVDGSEGFWLLTPVTSGGTQVVYESFYDPGGSLPSWLINRIVRGQVAEEYLTLHRLVRGPHHEDAS
jgi:hypothetical protein